MEGEKRNGKPPNPRASANPLSAVTFSWTLPIFWSGLKKELDTEDLFEPLKEHASGPLGDRISRLWESESARAARAGRAPSLLRVLLRAYALRLSMYGVLLLVMECGLKLAQPVFLGRLIAYYTPGQSSISKTEAYWYASGVVLCSAISVFVGHPYMMAILHMGMKFRVGCCSLIYRKSLRLSKTALGETTVGQVVNLLSNDVNRFDVAVIFLHYLWIGPLATCLITYLMWQEIDVAAVVGVAFMLAFIPLQAYLGKQTSVLRLKTALRTDERVRLMNEIISGIQVIKMYTWEKPFADLLAKARKREVKQIRATSYIRGVLTSFIMFTTRISLFFSILFYVLTGHNVTAEKVFVVTSYYNILRQTMTVFFPQGIAQVAEANISVQRLQKFMMYEETTKPVPPLSEILSPKSQSKQEGGAENGNGKARLSSPVTESDDAKTIKQSVESEPTEKSSEANGLAPLVRKEESDEEEFEVSLSPQDMLTRGIQLKNATAKWVADQPENSLTDISLTIKPGMLVGVIGPVGSGKTSLLHVLLRELPLLTGSVQVGGSVSYASQEPWLFAGTLRQNILFGQPMDRPRYNTVVRRCALDRDLALLPHGDKTIVGERGFSLSGGQRARVSLARAAYRRADIYLLDDPLSAVDAPVGRHLFDSCIVGYLRRATRVLVTHQLHYLKDVDQIIILKNGTIAAAGTYDTLAASGLDFAALLSEGEEQSGTESKLIDPADLTADDELASTAGTSFTFRSRQTSIHSVASVDNVTTAPVAESEARASGAVGARVYGAYLGAAAAWPALTLAFLIAALAQTAGSGADYWTSYWVNLEEGRSRQQESLLARKYGDVTNSSYHYSLFNETSSHNVLFSSVRLTRYDCIYIYTGIIVALVSITLIRSFLFFNLAMRASTHLHNRMFSSITRAPMRFFHLNPSGRILNRFSKDMGAVDEVLPAAMLDVLQIGLSLIGIVAVVAVVNYWLLVPTLGICFVFYLLRIFYLSSSRTIKRLEGVTRSPVFSHLNASLQGITTIRAFGAQRALVQEFDSHQDLHSAAWYLFIASSRAFGFWLDLVCVVYIGFVTMSFLVLENAEYGGNVGLAITQAMGLTGMFQWGMRQSTELENQMTSVERIDEYTRVESEPPLESEPSKKPPATWPAQGCVSFRGVTLRYAPDAAPVLRDLCFEVASTEKVGIVGRTGAGKSSLINAIFRLAYVEGSIVIDELDTADIGLHELRSQVSIIPQEPVLFSGTMRHNLDPFDEYPDSVLWKALEEVELKEAVMELTAGLNSKISEGGSNFSVGQRQLVCLARAIIRRNRILVLDEATANVDPQTDALIQTTIRNKFAECTVLTIAHRLHTVMDSDKVLVMDSGRVVEYDHPHMLLQRENGVLVSMVQQTGRHMAETLQRIAQQCYEAKNQRVPDIS